MEQIYPVLEAWQRGNHAHEPLTITPLGDGVSFMCQVGGKSEMNVKELCAFLGISRHAWEKKYQHLIGKNRNGKFGIRSAMALKERICGRA